MELTKVEGIVLSSVKYKENSKVLNILTKEKGLIGVISKGCTNLKSPLRIVSENFSFANFYIYYKEDKLSTLKEADPINYLLNIKSDIVKIGYLNYICDLTRNVLKENDSSKIYNLLKNAILKIEEGFNPKVITNILEVKYLDFLGIGLCLDYCSVCSKQQVVNISISRGGYVCSSHRTQEKQYLPATLKMIKAYYLIDIEKITRLDIKNEVIDEINQFLNIYYKEYSAIYLKSKTFLENIKDD